MAAVSAGGPCLADSWISSILGVDYAENGLRAAKALTRRTGASLHLVAATAVALPFTRRTFDGVLAAVLLDGLSRSDLERAMEEVGHVALIGARGFFVFNPYMTDAECAAMSQDNPTKDCMHVVYADDELPRRLPRWRVTRQARSAEGFRILEAVHVGLPGGGSEQPNTSF